LHASDRIETRGAQRAHRDQCPELRRPLRGRGRPAADARRPGAVRFGGRHAAVRVHRHVCARLPGGGMAGWLGDRHRRLVIAAVGVGMWSVATIGSGLAPSVIADLYPRESRGRALALFSAAIPVGTAFGYVLGGAIGTAWGWRAAFLVAGIPGLVLG